MLLDKEGRDMFTDLFFALKKSGMDEHVLNR